MPPKRPIQLQPPVPSSEGQDQGSVSDQGSGSKWESVELNGGNNKMKNPAAPSDDSDDDEDSESGSEESESESGSRKPDPTVQFSVKKITTSKPTSPVKSGAGVKRPAEKEPKRAKKKLVVSEEEGNGAKKDEKKPLFQRLWSENDEIVILKGIRDFVVKKGINSLNNMNAFHDFIKKSLHVDVSTSQLQDKVRRLKKKFLNNVSKEKEGKDRIFSKPHEQKSYDVSKKIWASDGKLLGLDSSKVNDSSARKNSAEQNARRPVEQSGARGNVQFGSSFGVGGNVVEHEILNDGLKYVERSKRVELEDKWKTLRAEECQLYLKKVELIQEQTTLILGTLKAGEED